MVIPSISYPKEVEGCCAKTKQNKTKQNKTKHNSGVTPSYACFPPFPCSVSQEVHSQTLWLSLSVGSYEGRQPPSIRAVSPSLSLLP